MTKNEKLILTLLSTHGPLTKKALASKGNMGWSTVVKMVTRLIEAGRLRCVGTEIKTGVGGKNAVLYDIAERNPIAIGIDIIEYTTTNIILTNFKNIVLEQRAHKTPINPARKELKDFLVRISRQFMEEVLDINDRISGIGVGVPLWLTKERDGILPYLTRELQKELKTEVRIENNVRCYAMHKNGWAEPSISRISSCLQSETVSEWVSSYKTN